MAPLTAEPDQRKMGMLKDVLVRFAMVMRRISEVEFAHVEMMEVYYGRRDDLASRLG